MDELIGFGEKDEPLSERVFYAEKEMTLQEITDVLNGMNLRLIWFTDLKKGISSVESMEKALKASKSAGKYFRKVPKEFVGTQWTPANPGGVSYEGS
jgi:hypothetical protein|tara:strand:- start:1396 stop:1686 length:291 start_codon:yes stop_codon:yes gene_type:complete